MFSSRMFPPETQEAGLITLPSSFCSKSERMNKNLEVFSNKLCIPQHVPPETKNALLKTLAISIVTVPKKFRLKCANDIEILILLVSNFFLEMLLWTRLMQFWKLCWMLFTQSATTLTNFISYRKQIYLEDGALITCNTCLTTLPSIFFAKS